MKKIIRNTLERLGYKIEKIVTPPHNHDFSIKGLQNLGSINTIIDVGVNQGTPSLYKAFEDCNIVLVDPLLDFNKEAINKIKKQYKNVFLIQKGCGHKKENKTLNFDKSSLGRSSMLKRTSITESKTPQYENIQIKCDRLDVMIKELNLPGPFGIKIDTEGFEMNVLNGSVNLFNDTKFIITETSMAKRFEESYFFEDLIDFMRNNNFRAYDILDISRSDDVGTKYLDIAFIRENIE